ncbi:hypothetical protein F8388_005259 [Cannabis sativa]|uniref:Uncharacterized protein n=1 Tax=Cannabis sativa TaxID=3483 RepID=A0A7J6FYZ6_CANSA|nr:hypothetical protein F8388_005259 [Cannabis sativa]KAF4375000.1 hypothetical protein G4B88_004751 [Cannabis sativa]
MKRKRGHKKGKSKKGSVTVSSVKEAEVSTVENESGLDEFDDNPNTPSSTGNDQPNNLVVSGKGVGKPLGIVKVKLKKPKIMESQLASSDAPTQSDTDKSSQQMGLERQAVVAEKMEDSANSLLEATLSTLGNSSKKAGSIKIKSSKSLGPSIKQANNDDVPTIREESPLKELKTPVRDHRYDKEELDTCLMVIQKVMKMDAAEPFNSPVNPIALGIPVNGEGSQEKAALSSQGKLHAKGGHSKKSKKGGRRHKADCLCAICVLKRRRREREENDRIAKGQIGGSDNNLSQELKQEESSPAESPSGENSSSDMDESSADPNATAEGEERKEGTMEESKQQSQPSAEKEKEEENEDEDEEGDDDDDDDDADGENGVEVANEENVETPEQFDKSNEDADKRSQQAIGEESGDRIQSDTHRKEDTTMQHEELTTDVDRHKNKEIEESHKKFKANQIKLLENPMLLDLCGVLFPDNPKSIWRGPHSLVHCKNTSRRSSIHTAIDSLMKSANQ